MKNKLVLSLSASLAALTYANEKPIYEDHPHRLYFGLPESAWVDLDTHVNGIHIDDRKYFWGINYGYEYLKPSAFYAGIDLLSTITNENFNSYEGKQKLSQPSGDTGFANLELRLGYTFHPNHWMVTTFLGLGAYAIDTKFCEHRHGFKETVPYYVEGVRTKYLLSPFFDFGINFKMLQIVHGQKHFKHHTVHATQSLHGWGSGIGFPLTWHIGKTNQWEIQLEPSFLRMKLSEPQNVYGLNFLFGYHF